MRTDEYDWDVYPSSYAAQLEDIKKDYTLVLSDNNYAFMGGEVHIKEECLQMHPQHKLLYETVLRLAPKDLHEIGCGRGNHIANIHMLSDGKIQVYGSDISEEQIEHLKTDHLSLIPFVGCVNIIESTVPHVDCVMSSAVLVHLSDVNCEKAILNMCMSARKVLVLQENFQRRDYGMLFKQMQPPGWESSKIESTHITFSDQEEEASSIIVIKKINESPAHIS